MVRPTYYVFALSTASAFLLSWAVPAAAYTVETSVTAGCHESLTTDALRAVRGQLATAAPLPVTSDEAALIDDLPFSVPDDLNDLGGVSLLIGVRDNDLKGRGGESIDELSEIHGNPDTQEEHCLRSPTDDGPTGTATALTSCRGYLHVHFEEAIDALDGSGNPDLGTREDTAVYLSIRGSVIASLPTFYVEMGRMLHAVEDGFTHDLRSTDGKEVTVTLNWTDYVNGSGDESVDGPQHMSEMDRCDDPDDLRRTRRILATNLATNFLTIALDPARTHDQKLADADALIADWYQPEAGCTYANQWCHAPELQYETSKCSCRASGTGESGSQLTLVAFGMCALLVRRARRRKAVWVGILTLLAALPIASVASAQTTPKPAQHPPATSSTAPAKPPESAKPDAQDPIQTAAPDIGAPPANKVSANVVAQQGVEERGGELFGHVGLAGALEKPGFAGALGAKLALGTGWMVGLDAELNPFVAIDQKRVRLGALNAYASLIRRYQMRYEAVNLRTTVSLGTSTLLVNLYGAPEGTTGIFFGVSFLGIEWKLARGVYLVVDPTNLAIAAPQLSGVPFAYPQYRFTIGLEFGG